MAVLALAVSARAFAADEVVARETPAILDKIERRIDLEWAEVEKASQYELQVAADPEFSAPVVSIKLKDTGYSLDLIPGPYYYRVRAYDLGGLPGLWTPTQDLFINPRPPVPLLPPDRQVIAGNLPDTGLGMEWKSSGNEIRYLIEIKTPDGKKVVKQETTNTEYSFFPRDPGSYDWTLYTLGAGGEEPGVTWSFTIEGVVDRKNPPKRIVRYVGPWWRSHWTLIARYGQSGLSYSITDMDLRARGSFSGLTGFTSLNLNWEWHDPVEWTLNGIPWVEGEVEYGRQTVLSESVVLPKFAVRVGSWYDEWLREWRFSPILEYGSRDIAIYQPRSSTEAVRSLSHRNHLGVGLAAEFEPQPFLTFGASLKLRFESGGDAGVTILQNGGGSTGDQLDTNRRAGTLLGSTGLEAILSGKMALAPRLFVQGRLRLDRSSGSWVPLFPAATNVGAPTGNTEFTSQYLSFDIGMGIKF